MVKMRVLEIHQSHGIYGSDRGFEEISCGLRDIGFEVYQFSLDNSTTIKGDTKFFLKTINLNIFQNIFSIKIASALFSYIKAIKPDIIHFHTIEASIFGFGLPIFYGKLKGAKIVKTQHDWGMICTNDWHVKSHEVCNQTIGLNCWECYSDKKKFFKNYFAKKFLRNPFYKTIVNAFTVPSLALCNDMRYFGFKNTRRIPHYIESPLIPSKDESAVNEKLIFVGRLVKTKGLNELISTFSIIHTVIDSVELHIVGKGTAEEIEDLKQLIQENDLQKFIAIHANASEKEKLRLLQSSKLCIVPSIWKENFPLVVLEAFSCGVPVVAFKIGGIPELLEDEHALAKWKDVNDLAEKSIQILNDEILRQKLIENNKMKLHRYEKAVIISQWSNFFQALKEGSQLNRDSRLNN
jgi:glycosyltransferase involved in cell wall biosynthesis